MKLLLGLLAAQIVVGAAPLGLRRVNIVDKFDDVKVGLNTFKLVNTPPGSAINYNSFTYNNIPLSLSLGPPSPPQVASHGQNAGLQQGQAAFQPANSSVKYWDEKSISYACVQATEETLEVVPVSCTIQITGVKASDSTTVIQTLPYNPGLLPLGKKFNSTSFPRSFEGVKRIDATLISSAVLETTTITYFDDNRYTAYIIK